MNDDRKQSAFRVRVEAAERAKLRAHPAHRANGDEQRWASANYAMSFTKGLQHDPNTGLLADRGHFEAFRRAIDNGSVDAFTTDVPVPPAPQNQGRRAWEAPTAGFVFDLQGPDAQAVTMAPPPSLGSAELAYEMAEVYELALLRDKPLRAFRSGSGDPDLKDAIDRLGAIGYPIDGSQGRPRTRGLRGGLNRQVAFRGSSPGVEVGPYLSQFLLIGSPGLAASDSVADGFVPFGPQRIDQRVPVAKAKDWMTHAIADPLGEPTWLEVQQGADVRDNQTLFEQGKYRFISTPRDLATYVHDDALYQAYLNACLLLLGLGAPFDPGFAPLSGTGYSYLGGQTVQRNAAGFALWGAPHILSLVTEVATRALKAVRYQKFNNHLRLRPEALAGRLEFRSQISTQFPAAGAAFNALRARIAPTVNAVRQRAGSDLLPMAFQEGSPMHPAYGAGHASVAGACVTILKAFFDTSAAIVKRGNHVLVARPAAGDLAVYFEADYDGANKDGTTLEEVIGGDFLTLEGELNKLAANISIGRNMAGVHYYSDYYDSLRLGEAIALGVLEEQALCYPHDPFMLSLPTFDGTVVRIGRG